MMNFSQVDEIFEDYYCDLRNFCEQNAPSSYLYYGETIEEVEQESDSGFSGYTVHIGSESAKVVAVARDCHNSAWHAIHADATPEQVRELFESCNPTEDFDPLN